VSKFFQALEHAERERAQARGVTTAEPAPAGRAATVLEPPPAEPVERTPPRVAEPAPPAKAPAFSALVTPLPTEEEGEIDDHLVSVVEPTSVAAEQYRGVRLAIENFRRERGTRVVGVASPARGDGKTTTTINLAGALAQSPDARVVVVEADLRHPSMARVLGLPGRHGLSAYLLDDAIQLDEAIEWPRGLGFAVITAGSPSSMPYELLASARLNALLTALRERFDFVLVDTPPTLPFPDVGILRDVVDGFVMVVRANRTPREQVRHCIDAIGPPRVLGMIFNDDDRTGAVVPRELPRRRLRDYLEGPLRAARGV
jgi:capsular exopolysaccharide synthesis family protein